MVTGADNQLPQQEERHHPREGHFRILLELLFVPAWSILEHMCVGPVITATDSFSESLL